MSVDITITSGDDFHLDFLMLDENEEPVTDLLGATGLLQIRSSTLSNEVLASAHAVIVSNEGSVQFTIPDTITETFLADGDMRRSLVYGTKITYSDGVEETPVFGRLMVKRGVVR